MAEKDKTVMLSVSKTSQESPNGYHFFLKSKHVNIRTGSTGMALVNKIDSERLGIMPGDELKIE
jgi:hypothetical protein